MLSNTSRWSHARGNTVVPSRWQVTDLGEGRMALRLEMSVSLRATG